MGNQPSGRQETSSEKEPTELAALQSDLQRPVDEQKSSLQPLAPENGVARYLRMKSSDVGEITKKEYRRKLQYFIEFCSQEGIQNLNQLDGRKIDSFRIWRREDSTDKVKSLTSKTMRNDMYLFRDLIRYLESVEAVEPLTSEKIQIPKLKDRDGVRDTELSNDRVARILNYLEQYKYASLEHIVWLLQCKTGRRPGGILSIDLNDVETNVDDPYIEVIHRGKGTSLKYGVDSEKKINISKETAEALDDYISNQRHDVTDSDEREPLLSTKYGRLTRSTMRKYFYKFTRPCRISGQCPHNRDIDECESAQSTDQASKCPSSEPPYAFRHGYITQQRRIGVPVAVICERCNVSKGILAKHYNERTEEERRISRRKILNQASDDGEYSV